MNVRLPSLDQLLVFLRVVEEGSFSAAARQLGRAQSAVTYAVQELEADPGFGAGALGAWDTPLVALSCELEGHPLGGGMLKLKLREATRVVLPSAGTANDLDGEAIANAFRTMRSWRHHGEVA